MDQVRRGRGHYYGRDVGSKCLAESISPGEGPSDIFAGHLYSDKEVRVPEEKDAAIDDIDDAIYLPSESTEYARLSSPPRKRPRLSFKKTRSQITPAEWESVKNIISDLYLDKDYTLSTVMEIMSKSPHNFHASPKMYKNKFETWGFRKNLTKNRVNKILHTSSIKTKIANGFSAARIDQYLRRAKAPQVMTTTHIPDMPVLNSHASNEQVTTISELDTTIFEMDPDGMICELLGSEVHELPDSPSESGIPRPNSSTAPTSAASHSSNSCAFFQRGNRKYAIILNADSLNAAHFVAESWGQQEYHAIEERQCPMTCGCRAVCSECHTRRIDYRFWSRSLPPHTHNPKFRVVCGVDSVFVDIFDEGLKSILKQALPRPETSEPAPYMGSTFASVKFGSRSFCSRFDGVFLLQHYSELKDFTLPGASPFEQDSLLDLELLVNGLLEDSEVWSRIGIEKLNEESPLDPRLLSIYINQGLMQGIQGLDRLFQRMSNRINPTLEPRRSGPHHTDEIYELDASPAFERHFHLATWNHYRQQVDETTSLQSPKILSEELIRQLPGHFILDNFHDDLTRDFPQLLPTVSRGTNFPIVFCDELSNFHTPESFIRVDSDIRAQQQTERNMMLLAACRSGALSSVNSLLGEGASPNCLVNLHDRMTSPIIAAIESRHENIVRLLAFRGANLDDKAVLESEGETLRYTALWAATKTNQPSIVRFLLDRGADLNQLSSIQGEASRRSFTCMSESARIGLTDMFKLLLMWNTSYSEGLKQTRLVNDLDPDAEQVKELIDTTRTGSLASFMEALEIVGNPNVLMFEGTPLSVAAQFNQPHKMRELLKRGADVNLASLYLSRSGQDYTAKALVKTVFGSQDIHVKFTKQYERLVHLSQSTLEDKLRSFRHHCYSYKQAWAIGIEVMQNICRGKPPDGPDRLHRTLALLAVARAVAETTVGETGDIEILDKFDTDLLRWQLIFPCDADLRPYRLAVRELWKVDLEGSFFLDLDFEDSDTLGRFNGLISKLIGGARGPLRLDDSSQYGLNASYSRWQERCSDTRRVPTPTPTILSSYSNGLSINVQENGQPESPPESTAPARCDKIMNREMILEKTSWLDPGEKAATSVFFFEFTSVAEHLVRGIVFSIVFVFIHGLRSLAKLYMEKCFGLVERFTVLLRVLGFLEACERVSYRKVHDGTPKLLPEQDNITEAVHLEGIRPATTPSNQWYNLISCSADMWI